MGVMGAVMIIMNLANKKSVLQNCFWFISVFFLQKVDQCRSVSGLLVYFLQKVDHSELVPHFPSIRYCVTYLFLNIALISYIILLLLSTCG